MCCVCMCRVCACVRGVCACHSQYAVIHMLINTTNGLVMGVLHGKSNYQKLALSTLTFETAKTRP